MQRGAWSFAWLTRSRDDAIDVYGALGTFWRLAFRRCCVQAYAKRVQGSKHQANFGARLSFFDLDRKSTRLNSSHEWISYAVFCLKKKKNITKLNTLEIK